MPDGPPSAKPAIRVAIIDSGVNAGHPHVGNLTDGVGFDADARGNPVMSDDVADRIGHGTAIAGVIHWRAPTASLCPVRIFHDKLAAPASRLFAALEWAIDHRFNIIHLSLGLRGERFQQPLLEICRRAARENILMVAAARAGEEPVYPAAVDTVIGVHGFSECREDDLIHHPGSPVEFSAHPHPRPLPGLSRHLNFRGASFAAAHVAGMAADILSEEPGISPRTVRRRLVDIRSSGSAARARRTRP